MPDVWDQFPDAKTVQSGVSDAWDQFQDATPAPQATPQTAPTQQQKPAGVGTGWLSTLENVFLAAKQGTSPSMVAWDRKDDRVPIAEVSAFDDGGGMYFDTPEGRQPVDLGKHTILKDPATGKAMVFPKDEKYAESGLKGAGRILTQGLVTGPVTGPAVSAAINVPRAVQATERAMQAADDLAAIERTGVSIPGVAFSTAPTRRVAKAISETPVVGAPMRNAIDDSYQSIRNAVTDVADDLSKADTFDKGGHSLQKGLERYQSQGVTKIDPKTLNDLGVPPVAPIKPADVMSKEAAKRLTEAEPIRTAAGGKEGLTRQQILTARRAPEDLSDVEVQTLIRTPSGQTSFRVRSDALYEDAFRAVPPQMRVNNSANPQRLSAVNTRNALSAIDNDIASNLGGQAVLTGELADRLRKTQSHFGLDDLRRIRSQLGESLSGATEQTLSQTQLKHLYGAVSRDIEIGLKDLANRAYINSKLPPDSPNYVPLDVAKKSDAALNKFRRADRYFRQSMGRIERFKTIVDAQNPERAMARLVQAARDGAQGDIGLIKTAMGVLRPEERADVAAVILRNLGKPTASARGAAQDAQFSPTTFVTNLSRMDKRAFDAMFPGEHGAAITDLMRAANRISNIDALANTSGSGTNVLNVGGATWAGTSMLGGDFVTPLLVGGGGWGLAALLAKPEYARWAAQMMTLRANAMQAPGRVNAQIITHVNRLGQMAKTNPSLRPLFEAYAAENGIVERGANEQPQNGKVEQPDRVQPSEHDQRSKSKGHEDLDMRSDRDGQGMKRGYADGGAVMGDLPRISKDPYDQIPITADGNEEAARAAQAKMYADNKQRIKDRSFVTYGDEVLIPNNIDDAIDMLVSGAAKAGEVTAAFPGIGTLIDDAGAAAGAGLKMLRGKPAAPIEIIPGASREGDAILGAERAKREAAQAAERAAREDAAKKTRGAAYQAEAAKRGSTGTVPALSPSKDRMAIIRGLPEGTAPMAIKGRQGMPTRDEQISLIDKYLAKGGRARDLPPGDGPWGTSPQMQAERAREAIQRAWDKDNPSPKATSAQPAADQPSVGELAAAYQAAKKEADQLRGQIKALKDKGRDADRLVAELKQTQIDMINLQQATGSVRRFRTPSEVLEGKPPSYVSRDELQRDQPRVPPRIYRKGQE